jgi:hypothetical protein
MPAIRTAAGAVSEGGAEDRVGRAAQQQDDFGRLALGRKVRADLGEADHVAMTVGEPQAQRAGVDIGRVGAKDQQL